MEDNRPTRTITLREVGSDPITRTIPIGGPDGAKSANLGDIMDHISKYHGSKSYAGMSVMINSREATPGDEVPDNSTLRVARAIRAGDKVLAAA